MCSFAAWTAGVGKRNCGRLGTPRHARIISILLIAASAVLLVAIQAFQMKRRPTVERGVGLLAVMINSPAPDFAASSAFRVLEGVTNPRRL